MANTQELREQRAQIWEQMQEVVNRAEREGRPLNEEDKAVYDRLESDLDGKGEEIARAEKHLTIANAMSSFGPAPSEVDPEPVGKDGSELYASAFNSWMRRGPQALDAEQAQALRGGFTDIQNAAGTTSGGAGGYLVPAGFRTKLIEAVKSVAAMRQVAEVITTETGNTLPWPTVDDTANEGVLIGENVQNTEQDFTFGTNQLEAYMYSSTIVRVSFQLLQDSAFDLDTWLAKALGQRIGRIQARHFTVGAGSTEPDGIATSATAGVTGTTGQTLTVGYDDLMGLAESIDPAYIEGGNCNWMMSQDARKMVRKIKDNQDRPLWEPSLAKGAPDSLLGHGVVLNNYVPVPAANAKSILFGDFREAYVIRDASDVALLRLTERYADYFQVGFVAFQRSDGTMQNAGAVKAWKHSAT